MSTPLNIVWFKRDLRVHDHAPLLEAARCGTVLPLYIVEPELWQQPDSSRRHWCFIHDSLHDLHHALAALGTPLCVRIGNVLEILQQIQDILGPFTLWSHEETGNNWTYQRDIHVAAWCNTQGLAWYEFPTNGVVRRLKSRNGWSAMRQSRMNAPLLPPPHQLQAIPELASQPLPSKQDPLFGSMPPGHVQAGGRAQGLKVLHSFLQERGQNYMQTISKPGVSARNCSRLSAHLAWGTLSAREIEQATQAKMAQLATDPNPNAAFFKRNLSAFLSRLAWRCHFIQKLEQQPNIELKCMHTAFEGMREPYHNEVFFNAWKTGQTGYPLVDACMRSLHENGWITFRMRAMLVSFASYHLWLDWRVTAPFLAQLFTDYEPGIHYAQFQMQSGVTGINAIRMYNPIKQSQDHDREGKFIRRYVPELRDVPTANIHEPWHMDMPPAHYPAPIVEHATAIKHARSEISKRWKTENFRDTSKLVNQKLGSRSPRPSKTKKPKSVDSRQMSLDF